MAGTRVDTFQTIDIEPLMVAVQKILADDNIHPINVDVNTRYDPLIRGTVVSFVAWFASHPSTVMNEEIVVETGPSTLWDHLKLTLKKSRWLPGWIARNLRVSCGQEIREIPVTRVYNVCPHASIPWSRGRETHIRFLMQQADQEVLRAVPKV